MDTDVQDRMTTESHLATARRSVCALCEFGRALGQSRIRCKVRPTVDIDFESGRCPLDRWPDDSVAVEDNHAANPTAAQEHADSPAKRDPTKFLNDQQLQLLETRRVICEPCENNRGMTVLTVKCRSCGCGGVSLLHGRCYLNKWPRNGNGAPGLGAERSRPVAHADRKPIVLRNHQSPGDIVVLTAAVRDLAKAHGDKFDIQIDTSCKAIWENNPYVTVVDSPADYLPGSQVVKCEYPGIHMSNQRPHHFIQAFTEDLERKLGVTIPITAFKGDIHLSDEEKSWTCQVHDEEIGHDGPFWIIVAGGKYDFTAKWWNPDYAQQVVDHFKGRITFVQCGEAGHWHPPLKGVVNLVGKTDLRQFIRLMYHADGVICPVTLAMHAAAAVPTRDGNLRPCVVIAGGREPVHWEQYPGHQFLHTIGQLDCCRNGGCWKSRCQKVGDGDAKDRRDLCEMPVEIRTGLTISRCLALIEPRSVVRAVETFTSSRLQIAPDHQSPRLSKLHRKIEHVPFEQSGVISLIVTTYGTDTLYTQACLESIRRWKNDHHELIVVAHDESPLLRAYLDACAEDGLIDQLLYTSPKHGHTRGVNLAIRHATGDVIFNVCNDILVGPSIVDECAYTLRRDRQLGLIGWHWYNEGTIWHDGQLTEYQLRDSAKPMLGERELRAIRGAAWFTGRTFHALGGPKWLCLCNTGFFGIRRETLDQIGGGFAKEFPHYWADDLLNYAVLDQGLDIRNFEMKFRRPEFFREFQYDNIDVADRRRHEDSLRFEFACLDSISLLGGGMSREESIYLHLLARSIPNGATVTNVGVWRGASAIVLLDALKRKQIRFVFVVCFDLPGISAMSAQPPVSRDEFCKYIAPYIGRLHAVETIRANTLDMASFPTSDFIFVDAGHTLDCIRHDARLASDCLTTNGVVAFHDYGAASWPAVKAQVDEKFKDLATHGTVAVHRRRQTPRYEFQWE